MSIHVISILLKTRLGSPTRKSVALKLADCADDEGRGIYPSVSVIAAETEVHERTVQRVLKEFMGEGLIVRVRAGGKGPKDTSEYAFDMERLTALRTAEADDKGDTTPPLDADKGDTTPPSKGGTVSPIDERRVAPCRDKGGTVPPEPSGNRKYTPPTPPGGLGAGNGNDVQLTSFDAFWTSWPTVPTESKHAAHREWRGLLLEEQVQAQACVSAYLDALKQAGQSKICHARTYLAERRFEGVAAELRQAADCIVIEQGTPEWEAWMAHWRDKDSWQVRHIEKHLQTQWQVPTRLPPQEETGNAVSG